MPEGFRIPFIPGVLFGRKRARSTVTVHNREIFDRIAPLLHSSWQETVREPHVSPGDDIFEELLKRDVTPRPDDFEELLKRPVATPAEREASEVFEELLRRRPTGAIGRVIGRALGPIGAVIDIAIPSQLGSGEAEVRGDFPLPDPPVIPPPPPPPPPEVPWSVDVPVPTLPPLPLPSPVPSWPQSSPLPPASSAPPTRPRSVRRRLATKVKDRLRDLLLGRFPWLLTNSASPLSPASMPAASVPLGGPAVTVTPSALATPGSQPRANPRPASLPNPLTGLGLGRLSLPRSSPSSPPGMSESCTQCAIDKCVQSAMDKQRRSRRKKGPKRRKQPKLCVSAPRSLSALLKLLK